MAEDTEGEVFYRMFITSPKIKPYFSHLDFSHSAEHLLSLMKKTVVGMANISTTSCLGHLISQRTHLTNFKLFNSYMLVTFSLLINMEQVSFSQTAPQTAARAGS